MRDFTLTIYKKLLTELLQAGYRFVSFEEFLQNPDKNGKTIILRHDVDKKPFGSLRTAEIENEMEIKGTYYFKTKKNEFPRDVIDVIAKLGHEIGYHYDDLNAAGGVAEKALSLFQKNLSKLRELAPIKTACMHGSPLSRYDNRDLWKNNDYHELGIIGEPYFDIDFNNVMYLTDTGRRWDGSKFNIRDRVAGDKRWAMNDGENGDQKKENRGTNEKDNRDAVCAPPAPYIHATSDIINALKKDRLPEKIMLTIHPQRWTNNQFFWIKELVWQKIKNMIKYLKIRKMETNQKK